MHVLVLNCGSTSVKYQLLDMDTEQPSAQGQVERIGMEDALHTHQGETETAAILEHTAAIRRVVQKLGGAREIAAVGHRVVHGGEALTRPVRVDAAVKAAIRRCSELAPLHNPPNLAGIQAAEHLLPGVPQVAVFDTAFHAAMKPHAYMYALPHVLYRRHGVRRYGFHGMSHHYVSHRLAELLGRPLADLRMITCHLGGGCSACAIRGGRSIDTSTGFTPLEGLVMGTRCGDVDPGVLPFLMVREELTVQEIASMLNKHSGLTGLAGCADFRELEEALERGEARAGLAFDVFAYRLLKYIGAYAAALEGVDAIAFTGGIGQHSWRLRERVLGRLLWLGVELDAAANRSEAAEKAVTRPESRVAAWVVPTNEELVIARETVRVLTSPHS